METDFNKTLQGQKRSRIPIWLMRQAGRYLPEYREVRAQAGDFLNLCYSPKMASEVTLQPMRRYDLDAAIIFSDILVVPHALGQNVWFETGEGPRLDPITDITALGDYDRDAFLTHLDPVFEAISLTRSELSQDKSLIGFAGAPWTLACYMINGRGSRDYQNVRQFAFENPEKFQAIIDRLTTSIIDYLLKKIEAGVDVLQIFDSWCGVLSVDEFDRWSIQPTKKIVEAIKAKHPNLPIIGFPRMAGYGYEPYILHTGVDAVSCDPTVPFMHMAFFQEHVCVQGNLDPLLLLKGGQDMVSAAQNICQMLKDKPFVFNLGHGVIKETDPDNVTQLIKTIRSMED